MQKKDIKEKINRDIEAFMSINYNQLTVLLNSLQQKIDLLSTMQKQEWETRIKRILLNHLLKEDLIKQLQTLEKEITSIEPEDPCPGAIS